MKTPIRIASIKQSNFGEDVEKGNPYILLVGMNISAGIVKTSMESPQRCKK